LIEIGNYGPKAVTNQMYFFAVIGLSI